MLDRRAVRYGLLFVAALAISAFTIRRHLDPFDEGLMLQAARRVAAGEVPYRDFLWPYGPAQPYLLAGLAELFGPSLLAWRVVRALTNAAIALAVYVLVRRVAPARLALVSWLAAASAMAEPTGPTPFPQALLLGLLALALATRARDAAAPGGENAPALRGDPPARDLIAAGALTGLAAAWRLDFAAYAAGAVVAALLVRAAGRAAALRFALAAAATGALVYLPFLLATGPATLWDRLVATGLRDREHWTLPLPTRYEGGFAAWPPGDLANGLRDVLRFYVPLLLLAGAALCAVAVAARLARRRWAPPEAVGLAVLAGGATLYLLSRVDPAHEMPLVAVLAALIPFAAASWPGRPRALGAVSVALLGVLALLTVDVVANRASRLVNRPHLEAVRAPAADGVRAPPAEARALSRVVEFVRARTAPDEPIYVAARRSDLVKYNNPLVYVLTDRDNASGEDFGLLTSARAQRRIATRLERARPPVIVRWIDPVSAEREPNLRGEPSGSRLLDRWIAARYRVAERVGHYELLVPRR